MTSEEQLAALQAKHERTRERLNALVVAARDAADWCRRGGV